MVLLENMTIRTIKQEGTLEEHSVSYKTVERIQRGSQQKGEIKKKWSTQLKQGQRNKMTKAATHAHHGN